MSIRESFLQQTGDLRGKLHARIDTLRAELEVANARRHEAWTEGDLRENSAYHEAENAAEGIQAELVSVTKQISVLDTMLTQDYRHSGFISAGSVVTLQYDNGRERSIMLVPDQLADREYGRIAAGSPIGLELEGKQAGDTVTVVMPQKTSVYKVLEVD